MINEMKNIIQFPFKKLKVIPIFLDILSGAAAEVSDTCAFHVVERCCDIFCCLKSKNFMFLVLITILLVVAYPGTELCACGL